MLWALLGAVLGCENAVAMVTSTGTGGPSVDVVQRRLIGFNAAAARPVVVLSGHEGSGKTAILERLVRRLRRSAPALRVVHNLDLPLCGSPSSAARRLHAERFVWRLWRTRSPGFQPESAKESTANLGSLLRR